MSKESLKQFPMSHPVSVPPKPLSVARILVGSLCVALLVMSVALPAAMADSNIVVDLEEDDFFVAVAAAVAEKGEAARDAEKGAKTLAGSTVVLSASQGPALELTAAKVRLGAEQSDGLRSFWFDAKPFGDGSSMFFEGQIGLNGGPTGGHRLIGDFALTVPDIDALRPWFPQRIPESFFGALTITGDVDGYVSETSGEYDPSEPLRGNFKADTGWRILGIESPLEAVGTLKLDDKRFQFGGTKLSWKELVSEGGGGWAALEADGKWSAKFPVDIPDPHRIANLFGVPKHFVPQGHFTGAITPSGKPSFTIMAYDVRADEAYVAGAGGWDAQIEKARISGRILDPTVLLSAGARGDSVTVRGVDLGERGGGLAIKGDSLMSFSANNQIIFGGEGSIYLSMNPVEKTYDNRFNLTGARAAEALPVLMPGATLVNDGHLTMRALQTNNSGLDGAELRVRVYFGELSTPNLFRQLFKGMAPEGVEFVSSQMLMDFPKVFASETTAIDLVQFDLVRRDGPDAVGSLRIVRAGVGLDGSGTYDAGAGLELTGALVLLPPLTAALVAEHPWMAALVGDQGQMTLPVVLSGELDAIVVEPAEGVRQRIDAAKAGEEVEPFPSFVPEPLDLELSPLPDLAYTD